MRGGAVSFVVVVVAAVLVLAVCPMRVRAADAAHAGHAVKGAIGVVGLDVYADGGRIHLLTAERATSTAKPALSYARSDDGGETWSTPVPVGTGQPTPDPSHRGLDPQIAASGDHLVAMWTTGAQSRFGRGPLATSISTDGGRTWKPGRNPADDGLSTDHAFADVAADDAGNFHAVWLDGRAGENTGKGLRYARSTDGGQTWSPNVTLDAACCECCWNSLLTLPGGRVAVLYRDKDPRDMGLTISSDAGKSWSTPATVGAFGWAFTGCPHVGGSLAASDPTGKDLHAVVWTAKGGDDVGAFRLSSHDGGRTWTSPIRLGGPQSSRPDIAASGAHIVATWDEYVEDGKRSGNAAFAMDSRDGGKSWSAPVCLSAPEASATYPRVVPTRDGFRVFWTEQGGGKPARWTSRSLR